MGSPQESAGATSGRSGAYQARMVEWRTLDAATLAAWARLEDRAIESNAYLSPHFVLPALRHLESNSRSFILLIEKPGSDLAGVGVFTPQRPGRHFPLPHLVAYRSRHSYLSGLLVDGRHVRPVIEAFFGFLSRQGRRWHGVEFSRRTADGPLADALAAAAASRGVFWHEEASTPRATLAPAEGGDGYLARELSAGRLKGLRRQSRRMGEMGTVGWQIVQGPDVHSGTVDRFLELEHQGWKGTQGTSLRSRPEDEAFFRESVDGFGSQGRAWFTELTLDGTVISSTSNFVSGRAGFAFKIGWDPAYAKLSPGMLNEVELIRRAPELFGHLEYLDSGAGEGSYIDEFWAGRRTLTSGMYATTALGRLTLAIAGAGRRLKRRLRR